MKTEEALLEYPKAPELKDSTTIAQSNSVRARLFLLFKGKGLWVEVLSISLFFILVAVLYSAITRETHGQSIYALDDPYISAAMAKNLVKHGVLGVTRYGFSSSSSSIIWPLLIAAVDLVVGVHSLNPFIINIVLAFALIVVCRRILTSVEPSAGSAYVFICLAVIILVTPLAGLVFVGLEHVLHAIATVGFAYVCSTSLSQPAKSPESGRTTWMLALFSVLVTSTRYEGLFLISVGAFLLLCRGRWKQGISVVCWGLLPVVSFGLLSKALGWFFLPNSVLLKGGNLKELIRGVRYFVGTNKLFFTPQVRLIFLIAGVLFIAEYIKKKTLWGRKQAMLLIFLMTAVLHMQFALVGWFFRYEAYLFTFGLLCISIALCQYVEQSRKLNRSALVVCAVILCVCVTDLKTLESRSIKILHWIPMAAKNIYDQQYQMSRFVQRYYPESAIAVNDIGAIDFFTDARCLDLFGLGTLQVAKLKLNNSYTAQSINSIVQSNDTKLVMVYDDWFAWYGGLPRTWIKAGSWTIRQNIVAGGYTVSFYATNAADSQTLLQNLKDFSKELPPDVYQGGQFTQH